MFEKLRELSFVEGEDGPADVGRLLYYDGPPTMCGNNYFSSDQLFDWCGENGFSCAMTVGRKYLPKDIPNMYLHKEKLDATVPKNQVG